MAVRWNDTSPAADANCGAAVPVAARATTSNPAASFPDNLRCFIDDDPPAISPAPPAPREHRSRTVPLDVREVSTTLPTSNGFEPRPPRR
ncbi:hypothetical protein GCM10028864_60990 [Microlunatus parietis]